MKNTIITLLSIVFSLSCTPKKLDAPWEKQNPSLWIEAGKNLVKNGEVNIPDLILSKENIGTKVRVQNLYDMWILNEEFKRPFIHYADVTNQCHGLIDLDFALTKEQWEDPLKNQEYYTSLETIIEKTAEKLIDDFGNKLIGKEKQFFIKAAKTTLWQESLWQHYFRHKDWFFVLLASNPFNKLGNWGITQIARASYKTGEPLSKSFFESKGYCSIASSIYYGMLHYYFNYLTARDLKCNGDSHLNKIIGAYNRYSSGYTACYNALAKDHDDMLKFQLGALSGFTNTFYNEPWKAFAELSD